MRFELKASGSFYETDDDRIRDLIKLGFVLEEDTYYDHKKLTRRLDMPEENIYVEINTLEELMEFMVKFGPIVMDSDFIEIYND